MSDPERAVEPDYRDERVRVYADDGSAVDVSPEEAESALAEGRARVGGDESGRVRISRDGRVFSVDAERLPEVLAARRSDGTPVYALETPGRARERDLEAQYGDSPIMATGLGLARGPTLAGSDVAITGLAGLIGSATGNPHLRDDVAFGIEQTRERNPEASLAGELIGTVGVLAIPGYGEAAAARLAAGTAVRGGGLLGTLGRVVGAPARAAEGLGLLAERSVVGAIGAETAGGRIAARALGSAAGGAVEGGVSAGAMAINESIVHGGDPDDVAERVVASIGLGGVFGAGAGGILGGTGAVLREGVGSGRRYAGDVLGRAWSGTYGTELQPGVGEAAAATLGAAMGDLGPAGRQARAIILQGDEVLDAGARDAAGAIDELERAGAHARDFWALGVKRERAAELIAADGIEVGDAQLRDAMGALQSARLAAEEMAEPGVYAPGVVAQARRLMRAADHRIAEVRRLMSIEQAADDVVADVVAAAERPSARITSPGDVQSLLAEAGARPRAAVTRPGDGHAITLQGDRTRTRVPDGPALGGEVLTGPDTLMRGDRVLGSGDAPGRPHLGSPGEAGYGAETLVPGRPRLGGDAEEISLMAGDVNVIAVIRALRAQGVPQANWPGVIRESLESRPYLRRALDILDQRSPAAVLDQSPAAVARREAGTVPGGRRVASAAPDAPVAAIPDPAVSLVPRQPRLSPQRGGEVFALLDGMKRELGAVQGNLRRIDPEAMGRVQGIYSDGFRPLLENERLWGRGAAGMQREVNSAYTDFLTNRRAYEQRFLGRVAVRDEMNGFRRLNLADPAALRNFLARAGTAANDLDGKLFREVIEATERLNGAFARHMDLPGDVAGEIAAANVASRRALDALANAEQRAAVLNQYRQLIQGAQETGAGMMGGIGARIAGGLAGGAVGGPVGVVAGAGAGGAVMALARPAERIRALSMLDRLATNMDGRVTKSVRAFVRRATGVGARAARALKGTANVAGYLADRDNYEERVRQLTEMTSSDAALRDRLSEATRDLDSDAPEVRNAIHSTVLRGAGFLATHRPTPVNSGGIFPGLSGRPRVLEQDRVRWMRYARVIDDPTTLLADLENGSLSPEAVAAARAVYPKLHQRLVEALAAELSQSAKKGQRIGYAELTQISILLGIAADPTLEPDFLHMFQSTFEPQVALSQPRQSAAPRRDLSESRRTGSQGLEARRAAS